jgi:hypothetical protein
MWEYLTPASLAAGRSAPEGLATRDDARGGVPQGPGLLPDRHQPRGLRRRHGLSSKAVGAKSDGLVQIENAYVPGAKFAYVHRSHSGRYGIVNSEEGYQNLRRFLLGDLEVTADLVGLELPRPGRARTTSSGRPRSSSPCAACRSSCTSRSPPTTAR